MQLTLLYEALSSLACPAVVWVRLPFPGWEQDTHRTILNTAPTLEEGGRGGRGLGYARRRMLFRHLFVEIGVLPEMTELMKWKIWVLG